MNVNIRNLIDNKRCYETIRELRWSNGVICPHCNSNEINKKGFDEKQTDRQKYECKNCYKRFDDLTKTIFSNHHQPLKVWLLCLYFMGLNLSNHQIAKELNLNKDDTQKMTSLLRNGIVDKKPEMILSGEVECDEVYIVAGHKGTPESVKKKEEKDDEIA